MITKSHEVLTGDYVGLGHLLLMRFRDTMVFPRWPSDVGVRLDRADRPADRSFP
jgi:hypothetical protein